MNQSLHIHQLKTRYRLSPRTRDSRQRLDAILHGVMQQALELALDEIGVAADEELCIREINSRVHLPLGDSDQSLAEQWSSAMVEQIRQAIEQNGSRDVLRFRSRLHALSDLATGVAYHRLQRAWAWRQLGLIDDEDELSLARATAQLVAALSAEPELIVPLLRMLSGDGRLLALLPRLSAEQWQRLSEALSGMLMPRIKSAAGADSSSTDSTVLAGVSIALSRSRIAGLLVEHPHRFIEAQTPLAALTVFIAAELEPAIFLTAPGRLIPRLERITSALVDARPELAGLAGEWLETSKSSSAQAKSNDAAAPAHDEELLHHTDRFEVDAAQHSEHQGDQPRRPGNDPLDAQPQVTDALLNEVAPWDETPALDTEWGGLFFLYPVMQELDLPHGLITDSVLAERSFAWTLYHLLQSLLPGLPDDTVCRVFAGMDIDEEEPWSGDAPISEAESIALDAHAKTLIEHLLRRLEWQDEAEQLLPWLCRRPARMQIDPGWLKVIFPLDAVDTRIRRAMLDLNPGFLPWLGRVVEFVYD